MEDSRGVLIRRWVVALCEPLLSLSARRSADEGAESAAERCPEWFRIWAAGTLSDIMLTLDPEDPWLSLSIDEAGAVRLRNGNEFGSWRDSTDILHVAAPGRFIAEEDLGLAALAEGLPRASALLLVAAADGFDRLREQLSLTPASDLFEVVADALRWAIHRRRIFTGLDDAYSPVTAGNWIARADKILAGKPWGESGAARLRASATLERGTISRYYGESAH